MEQPLREKSPNTEFFVVRIFPNTGKYGPEKTPYLDTFHTVNLISNCSCGQKFIYSQQ